MARTTRRMGIAAGLLAAAAAVSVVPAGAQIGVLPGALAPPSDAAKPVQNGTEAPAAPAIRVIPLTRSSPGGAAAAKPSPAAPPPANPPTSSAAATNAAPPASAANSPAPRPAPPSLPAAEAPADTNVGAAPPAEPSLSRRSGRVAALPEDAEPEDDARRPRRAAREWERRMGPFALAPLCEPGFWRWIAGYLEAAERVVAPTAQQKSQFDRLVHTAVKAKEDVQATCGMTVVTTPAGRLEAVETRLSSVIRAVQTVRPELDAFYASLSSEQKARLEALDAAPERRSRHRRGRHWSRR